MRYATAAISLIAILTAGCAYTGSCKDYIRNGFKVGPEYCRPAAAVSYEWIEEGDEHLSASQPNRADWWTVYGDPQLDALMEQMLAQNITLRIAALRIEEAMAIRDATAGALFPQSQTFDAGCERFQFSDNTIQSVAAPSYTVRSVGFTAAWELDLWGKYRRNVESADASLDQVIHQRDGSLVSLTSLCAIAYVRMRTAQLRLAFAKENLDLQRKSLNDVRRGFELGQGSELDYRQAESLYYQTNESVPLLIHRIRVHNNILCVLLGIPTRDLTVEIGDDDVPSPSQFIAIGIPADMLRHRPDVRAAEREVAIRSAELGVVAADLLPHFSIRGVMDLRADRMSDLFRSSSAGGVVSPGVRWDILNYGRNFNRVLAQDARLARAVQEYRLTVIQANSEAETAISRYLRGQRRLDIIAKTIEAERRSLFLAEKDFRNGETDYNRLFVLQSALVQDMDRLALIREDIASGVAQIYRAMGGGWEISQGIRRGRVDNE